MSDVGLRTDPEPRATYEAVVSRLVSRDREVELVVAAVAGRRDVLLEGPPGTGKTTLLHAIAAEWNIPLLLVEGNADLTPSKLIGHHDPARVLREGYSVDNFAPGPLVEAMRSGGFLYFEEFNRAPDDALNVLLSAMSERRLEVPRVGAIIAAPTFRVIASMNPFDNVGTTRLSSGIQDRFCRVVIDYQGEAAEREIVQRQGGEEAQVSERFVGDAVRLVRATREHPSLRRGSSVRGSIDLVVVGAELARLRSLGALANLHERPEYAQLVLDAALVALSGRIAVDEAVSVTAEDVLTELWAALWEGDSRGEP